jgi:hypothetical protein
MEEHCHGHHQLRIIVRLLVRQGLDEVLVKHLDRLANVHLRKT